MLPTLEPAVLDASIRGSGFLYIVVMDPAPDAANADFDAAVLFEHAIAHARHAAALAARDRVVRRSAL